MTRSRFINLRMIWISATILSLGATPHNTLQPSRNQPINLSKYDLKPVYENSFSQPQNIAHEEDFIERSPNGEWRRKDRPAPDAEWIAEGWGGCTIRDGKLWVAPSALDENGQPKPVEFSHRSHMVVWNRQVFPSDFLMEFDMDPCGSTNGLAIVLFCATGKNGKDLFDLSLPPRRADYRSYHSGAIANYTDAYWSRNNEMERTSNRLRKNPGFNEVAAGQSLTGESGEKVYHVRILKCGAHIEVEINGNVVFQWDDTDTPHGAGRIGLRSMAGVTKIAYDNFKVWQVTPKPNRSTK